MEDQFKSYAFKDLTAKQIKKYAKQYDGVDMAARLGADEDNFPFVIEGSAGDQVMVWNSLSGIMIVLMEDEVEQFATARFLIENAYPSFSSIEEASRYASEHDWPRKQ